MVPTAALFANPPAVIAATLTLEELHATWLVMLKLVPSVKCPVAVNCCDVPRAMFGLGGATVSVVSVALVTVTPVDPTTPANVAVMVEVPGATPITMPALPVATLTVATDGAEEVHVTELVRFCVLPSANVPVAVYCMATCAGKLEATGVTAMDCSAEDSTMTLAVLAMLPSVAVIVAEPADCPVAWPADVIDVTRGSDVLQITTLVMFWVVPSL